MLNRGIPHDELTWNDAGNGGGSWTIHVNTELFGSVQVDIPAKTKAEDLTDVQRRSLDMLRKLPKTIRPALIDALRKYAIEYRGNDFDPDDCTFSCDNASIPYLNESKTAYVFLNASSEIDDEHGVCFLIRNGDVVACCHGDESLEFYGWDSIDDLDALAQDGE